MRKMLQHADNKFLQDLGDVIRGRRIDRYLSQKELGSKCGVHRTYITEIEGGMRNMSLLTLRSIAGGLEMHAWQLMRSAEKSDHSA
jgi:transcriptional regulator with XRE-family HTH domain